MFIFLVLGTTSTDDRRPTTIQLSSEGVTSFDDWVLVLDNDQRFFFDNRGKTICTPPPDSITFEIIDDQERQRFLGSWATYGQGENISLQIRGETLNLNQVVSASRIRQEAFRVPVEVEVIRPADQAERGTAQTSDWLKEQAEVLLQKTNLGGGAPIMRGMSGNRILLMVDGFRINNATFRLGLNQYLNTVPADQLEQIEVLSGPTGVQYGSDGLGGTIHLRTADPASDGGGALAYRGLVSSADGTHTHRLSGQGQVGKLFFNGHFKINRYEDLEAADPVGEQSPTGFDAFDTSFNLSYKFNEATRLRLINSLSQADNVPRTDRILSGRDRLWEYHPQDYQLTGLRLESRNHWLAADYMDIGVAFMRQKEGNLRISSGSPEVQTETLTTVDTLQFNGTFTRVTKHYQFVYGFDASSDRLEASGREIDLVGGDATIAPGKFPGDAAYESMGLFATAQRELGLGLTGKLGLRQSFVTLRGTLEEPIGAVDEKYKHLTPSASISRNGDKYFVSLSTGQGFRAPNLEDALSLGPSNKGFDAPNPNLEPEDVWNYELNLRFNLAFGLLRTSLYTARYSNLIERIPGSWLGRTTIDGEPVFMLDNVGKASVDGVSLGYGRAMGTHHRLNMDAAWVYGTQTDLKVPMTRIPPLRGNLNWRYSREKWQLTSVFSWAARQDRLSPGDLDDSRIAPEGTPGYGVFHLRGRYHFTRTIAVNLALENLGDKLYKSHGSGIYEPGRRAVLVFDARWGR